MNSPLLENNKFEFDLSKLNITTGADVTFSIIHPSLASSNIDSLKERESSSNFLTSVISPEHKYMLAPDDQCKHEELIKYKITNIHPDTQNDYFFDSTFIEHIHSETPRKKIKREIEKLDLNENLNMNTENQTGIVDEINKKELNIAESVSIRKNLEKEYNRNKYCKKELDYNLIENLNEYYGLNQQHNLNDKQIFRSKSKYYQQKFENNHQLISGMNEDKSNKNYHPEYPYSSVKSSRQNISLTPFKSISQNSRKNTDPKYPMKYSKKENLLNKSNVTLNMDIKISGYVIKNIIFQHIKYILTIKKFENDDMSTYDTYKIYRRYSQFKILRDLLRKKYIGIFLPSLPRKQIFGKTDINLIEFRKKFLQLFLHELQLCYFFNESEEVQAFLDQSIDNFPPENLKIINEMNNLNEDILYDGISENLWKTYKINSEGIGEKEFINTNERNDDENEMNIEKNKIFSVKKNSNSDSNSNSNINLYKTIDLSLILEKLKNLNEFSKKLTIQKNFLEDIRLCFNHFIDQQKDISNVNMNFVEGLIEFQNNCIFPMADQNGKNEKYEKNEKKIIDENYIQNTNNYKGENINEILSRIPIDSFQIKKILKPKAKKTFGSILKNLHDWIYKEIIDTDSITECIGGLKNYLNRLREVEDEIKKSEKNLMENNKNIFNRIDENSHNSETGNLTEYVNFDLKEKLQNKKERLKEIIVLSTMNIYNHEIEKFKNMKFQYYYNSLRFVIEQNNFYRENEFKMFSNVLNGLIKNFNSKKANVKTKCN